MKAIILAAGKSPRLLPLTKDIPQPLLQINNKTILDLQIENLRRAGVDDISIVGGYLSDKLKGFGKEAKILFNPFYEVSGIAASLWSVKDELKNGFIILYSDILFDFEIIKELSEVKEDICLAIKKNGLRDEAEKVVEENGLIKSITKNPAEKENGEFVGIIKFSAKGAEKMIKELESVLKDNLSASLIAIIGSLIKKGETVFSYDIKNARFIDIDFPEDLEQAKKLWK